MHINTDGDNSGPTSEINITPLADVMLVCLIIFMITTPLMQHKIKVKMPEAALTVKPDTSRKALDIAISADGSIYLNDTLVGDMELKSRLALAAQTSPQPEVQIRADKTVEYRTIWDVMSTAKKVGIVHLGFKTFDPGQGSSL